jgi:hypothetical protein
MRAEDPGARAARSAAELTTARGFRQEGSCFGFFCSFDSTMQYGTGRSRFTLRVKAVQEILPYQLLNTT